MCIHHNLKGKYITREIFQALIVLVSVIIAYIIFPKISQKRKKKFNREICSALKTSEKQLIYTVST